MEITAAVAELAAELKLRGAAVYRGALPDLPESDKTGADDFLAHPDGGLDNQCVRLVRSSI